MKGFLILGTQRTGSSAFAELLAMHPDIGCGWEWANRAGGRARARVAERALAGDGSVLPAKHARQLYDILGSGASWLGFRLLFRASHVWVVHPRLSPSLWLDGLSYVLKWVEGHPDIHVIHLVRGDSLEWLKSKYMAKEAGTYAGTRYPTGLKVKIPVGDAIRRLQCKHWIDGRIQAVGRTNPYIQLSYEQFREDNSRVVKEAVRFLGCDPTSLRSTPGKLSRQSTESAVNYIANYQQLVKGLRSAGVPV